MLVGHDVFVMCRERRRRALCQIEPEERKKLVVERHGLLHVPDRDFDVADGWFHGDSHGPTPDHTMFMYRLPPASSDSICLRRFSRVLSSLALLIHAK